MNNIFKLSSLFLIAPLLATICIAPCHAIALPNSKIKLKKGERKEILLSSLERHQVDNLNVIHVTRKNNKIILNALITGNAKIDIVSFGGKTLRTYLVKVAPTNSSLRKQNATPEFCKNNGIVCSIDLNRLTGLTDSWKQRNQAIYYCRRRSYCTANIRLSQKALDAQKSHYQETFDDMTDYETAPTDLAILKFNCSLTKLGSWKKLVNILSNRAQSRGAALVQCGHAKEGGVMYKLKATIKLSAMDSDEKSDAISDLHPKYGIKGKQGTGLGKSKHSRQSVLARPEIFVIANKTTKLKSGSEMPVYDPDSEYGKRTISWKPIGLAATFLVSPQQNGALLLHYSIALTQSGRSDSLRANQLEGNYLASLGATSELGRIFLDTEKFQHSETFWLRNVPLVGPLFKAVESNSNKVSIIFDVTITEENKS